MTGGLGDKRKDGSQYTPSDRKFGIKEEDLQKIGKGGPL
jgi:hypothetical protein